jgi:hypothetical protein
MKLQQFKIKRILSVGILIGIILLTATCGLEQDLLNKEESLAKSEELSLEKTANIANEGILELSYVIETVTRFITEQKNFSNLDLASMVPKKEKKKINLTLFENGQVSMIIESRAISNPIKIPHKTLPNDMPEVYKTVIENNTVSFYDKTGNLLSANPMEMPDHSETVSSLLELSDSCYSPESVGRVVARLQGSQFTNDLNEFVADAKQKGAVIMDEDEQFMTIRMSLGQIEPGVTDDVVLLIDKDENRTAGTRIYNSKGELLLSTLFGYGPPEKPFLTAIKQQTKEKLPSGEEIVVESYSKIDNLKFKINI